MSKETPDADGTTSMRDKIIMLRHKEPELKAADLARKLGVSRERIRQLLALLELPTKFPKVSVVLVCSNCGIAFSRDAREVRSNIKQGYKHVFCSQRCLGKHNEYFLRRKQRLGVIGNKDMEIKDADRNNSPS